MRSKSVMGWMMAAGMMAAGGPALGADVKAELAPTGVLRVGLVEAPNAGVFFVGREAGSGKPHGVAAALAAALAERLGLPVAFTVFPNSGECTSATNQGAVDMTFMPADAARREKVDFGPAYYQVESTYLVSAASGLTTLASVDQAHVRVVGIDGTTTIRASGRTLKHTQPQPARSVEEAAAMLRDGRADAFALSRDSLKPYLTQIPGSRIVDGGFQHTGVAIAVPPGRKAALAAVSGLLETAKADGTVRAIFDRHGLQDEPVAPAGS